MLVCLCWLPVLVLLLYDLSMRHASYKSKRGDRFLFSKSLISLNCITRVRGNSAKIPKEKSWKRREEKEKMWSLCLVLAVASIRNGLALPQIDEQVGGNGPSEADGFVFDGPVSGPRSTTTDGIGGSSSETSSDTRSTTTTPITTTPMPGNDVRFDRCVAGCLATPEYNPVCGSDSVNYDNPGRLNCAAACGKDVTLRYYGRCMTSKIRGG